MTVRSVPEMPGSRKEVQVNWVCKKVPQSEMESQHHYKLELLLVSAFVLLLLPMGMMLYFLLIQ